MSGKKILEKLAAENGKPINGSINPYNEKLYKEMRDADMRQAKSAADADYRVLNC